MTNHKGKGRVIQAWAVMKEDGELRHSFANGAIAWNYPGDAINFNRPDMGERVVEVEIRILSAESQPRPTKRKKS